MWWYGSYFWRDVNGRVAVSTALNFPSFFCCWIYIWLLFGFHIVRRKDIFILLSYYDII